MTFRDTGNNAESWAPGQDTQKPGKNRGDLVRKVPMWGIHTGSVVGAHLEPCTWEAPLHLQRPEMIMFSYLKVLTGRVTNIRKEGGCMGMKKLIK